MRDGRRSSRGDGQEENDGSRQDRRELEVIERTHLLEQGWRGDIDVTIIVIAIVGVMLAGRVGNVQRDRLFLSVRTKVQMRIPDTHDQHHHGEEPQGLGDCGATQHGREYARRRRFRFVTRYAPWSVDQQKSVAGITAITGISNYPNGVSCNPAKSRNPVNVPFGVRMRDRAELFDGISAMWRGFDCCKSVHRVPTRTITVIPDTLPF